MKLIEGVVCEDKIEDFESADMNIWIVKLREIGKKDTGDSRSNSISTFRKINHQYSTGVKR